MNRPALIGRRLLKESARLALLGIGIGMVASALMSRIVARVVDRVSPLDSITFITAPLALGGAALLATLIPARRAAQADPMQALRADYGRAETWA